MGCGIKGCDSVKAVNDFSATVSFSGSDSTVLSRVSVGGCATMGCCGAGVVFADILETICLLLRRGRSGNG